MAAAAWCCVFASFPLHSVSGPAPLTLWARGEALFLSGSRHPQAFSVRPSTLSRIAQSDPALVTVGALFLPAPAWGNSPVEAELRFRDPAATGLLAGGRTWLVPTAEYSNGGGGLQTVVDDAGGVRRHLNWVAGVEAVAVVGHVAEVRSCESLGFQVVAVQESGAALATVVSAELRRALAMVPPSPGDDAMTVIVASRADLSDSAPRVFDAPLANVFDPETVGMRSLLRRRVCMLVAARVVARRCSDLPTHRSLGIAAALALALEREPGTGTESAHGAPDLEGAALAVNEFGTASCAGESDAGVDPHTLALIGQRVISTLLWLDESAGPELRRLVDDPAERRGSRVGGVVDQLRRAALQIDRDLVIRRLRPALAAASSVVPGAADAAGSSGSPVIEVASRYDGYLEECGCTSARALGGLTRLVERWQSSDADVRVVIGEMVAPLRSRQSAPGAARVVLQGIEGLPQTCFVPGVTELTALARGEISVGDLRRAGAVACNVTFAGERLPGYRVFPLRSGGLCVVIGVCAVPRRSAGAEEVALVARAATFDPDTAKCVGQVLADVPPDCHVILAGSIAPARLAEIAGKSRPGALLVTTEFDWPRLDGDRPVPFQSDGRIGVDDVVFARAGRYGVDRIERTDALAWAHTVVELRGPVDPATGFASAVGQFLRGLGDDKIEAVFDEEMVRPGNRYVGSGACAGCHPAETAQWHTTPHARAMDTLRKKQRHRVANCVACHVVGFGAAGGYSVTSPDEGLENVGCEVCHGPGQEHIAVGGSAGTIRRVPPDAVCAQCHNEKHSDFLGGMEHAHRARIVHSTTAPEPRSGAR